MEDIVKDLEQLRKKIDEVKVRKARLEGQDREVDAQLRSEFNCRSLEAAEERLESGRKKLEAAEREIESQYRQLKENYEWGDGL